VFVGSSILQIVSLFSRDVGVTYICVSVQNLSDITARVFVQLLVISKYYDCDINGAENGKLMRLLEETTFALEKCSVG
jgi:hypothetical protein